MTLDQLGSVSRGRSRHRPRDAEFLYDGPYPFVQTGDVKRSGLYLRDYEQTYSEAGLSQSKLWPVGTLCITIAANIAETSILDIEACFPDSVIGFIADQEKADTRFIKYLFDAVLQMRRRSFTLAEWEPAEGLVSGKWRFEEGDILFCKIRPYFHKVGFTMRRGLVSSDALVWRVHDEADWPIVLCATSSDHFVAVASKTVREGSKMPRADWNVLREYVIPKPPRTLIMMFNDTTHAIAEQCKTLALHNRSLAEARDLLLPRLINGEIAV